MKNFTEGERKIVINITIINFCCEFSALQEQDYEVVGNKTDLGKSRKI